MIKHYIKISFRNFLKYKVFSFINVFGLALSMSVCMLIMLMWVDQKSYDQFHQNKERIYRVVTSKLKNSRLRATIPFPTIDILKNESPAIEEATFLRRGFGGDAVYTKSNNQFTYSEMKGYFTDPAFFKIFDFKLEKGNPVTALEKPNSVVITKAVAEKLFGKENPLGKQIQFSDRGLNYWTEDANPPVDWGTFTITGVFQDSKKKSHLKFEAMASSSSLDLLYKEGKIEDLSDNWSIDHQAYGYVMLKKTSSIKDLQNTFTNITNNKLKNNTNESLKEAEFYYQALTKITPGAATGNSTDTTLPLFVYYVLGGLALIIMLSSCLNYTSLSVARAITRSNEIGVRKVNGADRWHLIFQFICEAIITVFLSLILANIFLFLIKNAFLKLWLNQYLQFDLNFNLQVYLIFIGFTFFIGLVAGVYPAVRMSKFNPVKTLKNMEVTGTRKKGLRRTLIVTQFVISMVFIVTSIVIFNQLKYYTTFDYGFNPTNVLNVNLQSKDYQLVKEALSSVPGVEGVSACAYVPADGRNDHTTLKKLDAETGKSAIDLSVDENFADVLQIEMVAGEKFIPNSDGTSDFVLVNEQTYKEFGYNSASEIIGQVFEIGDKKVTVSGVLKDITFFLLYSGRPTGPIVFQRVPQIFKYATIRIASENTSATIARLEEKWQTIDKIHPLEFEFYDEQLAENNQAILDVVSIISFLSFLAVIIACLGMFGMAHHIIERRTKEIGIRKVLGANSLILNYLLSKEFLIMMGLAIIIATPLSYFINKSWLDYMAVRVDLGLGTLIISSLIMLILGLVTIIPLTLRISIRNPIEALKIE